MLLPVNTPNQPTSLKLMHFNAIEKHQHGTGVCFVYNAQIKNTREGKPFVTLYLRDVDGNTLPAYIFNLESPIFAGFETTAAIGNICQIDWRENYLNSIGMTLIIDKFALVKNPAPEHLSLFCGIIENMEGKLKDVQEFFMRALNTRISFPPHIKTYSSPNHMSGRVGGLAEHYYRMMMNLQNLQYVGEEEFRRLTSMFAVYIYVHASYVRANDNGEADVTLVDVLMSNANKFSTILNTGPAAMELVHMFFGYTPKDVHVRTIALIADTVTKIDKEFSLYKTLPLTQEGDAGYGKIKRYTV